MKKRFLSVLLTVCLLVSMVPFAAPLEASALDSRMEKAIAWAVAIANDNTHGYSQANRYGPDYDCSSLIGTALKVGGFDVKIGSSYTFYTGNMIQELTKLGFKSYTKGSVTLQRGDIIMCHNNARQHTEMYLGNNQLVGAHWNYDGKQGDSSREEIDVYTDYSPSWYTHVLRYGGSSPDYPVTVKTDQYATVRNSWTKSYLNISGNSSANNANATVNSWTGGSGEDFKFVKNGAGYLLVPRCATSRALNIYGDAPGAGANVCTWTTTKHGTQTWIPEYVESMGGFLLRSAYNQNLLLTASGSANGSNVCVQTYNGKKNQIWTSDLLTVLPTNLKTNNKSSYTLGETVTIAPTATGAQQYSVSIWDGGAFGAGNNVFQKLKFTGSVSYKPTKAGTYSIRMDAHNGAGKASIDQKFTVSDIPCSLSFTNTVSSLNVGETKTLRINYTAGSNIKTIRRAISTGAVSGSWSNATSKGIADLNLTGQYAGTANITISLLDENEKAILSKSFSITVNPLRVSSVSLNKSSLNLTVGQSELLSASIAPSNATNRSVTWSSSNSSVVSVSGGAVTARNPGTAVITATVDGKSASCQVTVKGVEVSRVTVDRASAELRIGDTIQLNASVYPSNAADRSVSWRSDDSSVASVSSTGLVTAKGEGLVRVWARAGGKEDYCSILVVPREVEGLTLSASELELSPGETQLLSASVYPSDAWNSTVTWSSSAPEIVQVVDGWLTALKPGKAVITAKAGSFSKTCAVTVSEIEVEELRISESFLELAPEETKTLSVGILPESAANRSVSWSSSDREIAVVENGQVTGISPGFVKITAACGRLEATCYVRVLGVGDELLDPTEENEFVDVPNGAYFSAAVDWAVEKGITAGTDKSHFRPNQVCTRAQAVTFLWRAAGSPKPLNAEVSFTDISETEYYYDAVIWAAERGITGGVGENRFAPNDKCTRAQIVCFMHRMEGMPEVSSVSPFRDVPPTMYYANSVAWAVENGITAGTSATTFSPHNDCSRGQIVSFLYRFLG